MKSVVFLLTAIFLIAGCATVQTENKKEPETPVQAESEDSSLSGSFSLELEKIDGGSFSFSEIKGKKHLVVAFWATWCEPCKAELQKLAEIYPEFSEHIEFVAVSTDTEDLMDKVNQFAVENSLPFPVLIDPSGNTVSKLVPGGDSVPYSIIVHKNGNVISRHTGYKSGDEQSLKKELEELLLK